MAGEKRRGRKGEGKGMRGGRESQRREGAPIDMKVPLTKILNTPLIGAV